MARSQMGTPMNVSPIKGKALHALDQPQEKASCVTTPEFNKATRHGREGQNTPPQVQFP